MVLNLSMVIIKKLKECPDYAPILAFWSYNEWYGERSIDFDIVIKSYQKRANDTSLPISWVAIYGSLPIGMVSLKKDELWSRKDLEPWLSSLYVLPEYRNHGIGTKLIESVIAQSRELEFRVLYLYISGKDISLLENFYNTRGWTFMYDAIGNEKNDIKIFSYNL